MEYSSGSPSTMKLRGDSVAIVIRRCNVRLQRLNAPANKCQQFLVERVGDGVGAKMCAERVGNPLIEGEAVPG